jgi:hypothetical protein
MDRLDELAVFTAILDAGSLAGAARKLRRSPPAVTRSLAALEERVGARLVRRTTRRLAPTEPGRRLASRARQQLTTSTRDGSGGTGLGLPLTKALAEANRARFRSRVRRMPGRWWRWCLGGSRSPHGAKRNAGSCYAERPLPDFASLIRATGQCAPIFRSVTCEKLKSG